MTIRCSSCGASLQVQADQTIIDCPYCGSHNEIRRKQPRRVPVGGAGKTGRGGRWIAPVVLLLVAGGAVFAFIQAGGMKLLREWYSPPCVVDANGDEVLDIAGWSGTPTAQRTLTVVDGITGDTIWTHDGAYPNEANVLCAPPDAVVVTRPDFTVEVHDARTGAVRGTAALPDKVLEYGRGDGCVRLWTSHDLWTGVGTSDAAVGDCATGERLSLWRDGVAGPTGHQQPVSRGDVTYAVEARSTGTALMTFRASRAGAVLWETPLNLVAEDTSALPLVATEQTVVTWGLRPGDSESGWIVGLDPESGRPRYEQRQGSSWSADLQGLAWNGRFVVAMWGFGLHAYDPQTGERRWHIGGR